MTGFQRYMWHVYMHGDSRWDAWCEICIINAERDGLACRFPRLPR